MARLRIRSLKPEIFQHEKFGQLSDTQRLLFIGLITMADDHGRLRELASVIIGHVFPYESVTAKKLGSWLHKLARAGLIERYEADGIRVIQLHGWRHQRVSRPNPSELPPPPSELPPPPSETRNRAENSTTSSREAA